MIKINDSINLIIPTIFCNHGRGHHSGAVLPKDLWIFANHKFIIKVSSRVCPEGTSKKDSCMIK